MEIQTSEPGWYPDPTGRHEFRYWTGTKWSRHVENGGVRSSDPLEDRPKPSSQYVVRTAEGSRWERKKRRRRRVAMIAVGIAVLLGLAGGVIAGLIVTLDDDTADQNAVAEPIDPLTSALTEYIVDTTVGTVSDDDAACMTDRIIETVGREALVDAGVDQGADPLVALSDAQVQAGLAPALDCLDDATLTTVMTETFSPSMLAGLAVDDPGCLIDGWMAGLGRDTMIQLYALWASTSGADVQSLLDPAQVDVLVGVVAECQPAAPPP